MRNRELAVLVGCAVLTWAAIGVAKQPRQKAPSGPVPGSLAYLDAKNGFRDMKFGGKPTSDMELARVDGEERMYIRPSDSLEIGNGTAKQILYMFHKDQLRGISVTTEGWKNNRAMRDSLHAAYGPPSMPSEYGGRERWIGNKVVVEYSENRDGNAITFYRVKAAAESESQNGKEKNKPQKGIGDL